MPPRRPRARLLALAHWAAITLCVVVVLLYAASFRWWGTLVWWNLRGNDWRVTLDRGWVDARRADVKVRILMSGPAAEAEGPAFAWERIDRWRAPVTRRFMWGETWVPFPGGGAGISRYSLPAWPLALAAGAGALGLTLPPILRRRARRGRGACETCGYSRVGLAKQIPCPECGAAPAERAR